MKLLLRRDQRPGMLGKVIFSLAVRAELSPEERASIDKYKLGDTLLYEKNTILAPGHGALGLATRLAHHATNISVSVYDLIGGKKVECKSIVEMLAIEEQIREAGETFIAVLRAAARFGGEEVLEL